MTLPLYLFTYIIMKHHAKIVTYCHSGRDMKEATDNTARLAVLDEVADQLAAHPDWHPIDAVVFPGGFLSEVPDKAAAEFVKKLVKLSPGIQLVVGVDMDGQQLAMAFNSHGLSGSARKLFPVGEDVDGQTFQPITLREQDYADTSRFIKLANGSKALLCVCYDMFGLGDTVRGKMDKLNKAILTEDNEGKLYPGKEGRSVLHRAFNAHRQMIAKEKPDIALATIHRFEGPGREIFWQRHGIATASAALQQGFAAAAAHVGKLPNNSATMPLAANNVPSSHMNAGMKRQAHTLPPEDYVEVHSGKDKGLLRLFAA